MLTPVALHCNSVATDACGLCLSSRHCLGIVSSRVCRLAYCNTEPFFSRTLQDGCYLCQRQYHCSYGSVQNIGGLFGLVWHGTDLRVPCQYGAHIQLELAATRANLQCLPPKLVPAIDHDAQEYVRYSEPLRPCIGEARDRRLRVLRYSTSKRAEESNVRVLVQPQLLAARRESPDLSPLVLLRTETARCVIVRPATHRLETHTRTLPWVHCHDSARQPALCVVNLD